MKQPQAQVDPQILIVNAVAAKYLLSLPEQSVTLTQQELQELIGKYTLRLEILNVTDPVNSPIQCSLISIEEAMKMVKEMQKGGK